jgi:hypothetical protein
MLIKLRSVGHSKDLYVEADHIFMVSPNDQKDRCTVEYVAGARTGSIVVVEDCDTLAAKINGAKSGILNGNRNG